jgi:hypothetical protein
VQQCPVKWSFIGGKPRSGAGFVAMKGGVDLMFRRALFGHGFADQAAISDGIHLTGFEA